jgi:hypothetical protein
MTTLTNTNISATYGDVLTTTNGGAGLSTTLQLVQDGLGNSSPMSIATDAVNFVRGGNTFQLDSIALTASATNINLVCGSNATFPNGINFKTTTVHNSYVVLITDYYVFSDNTSGGAITITLPDAAVVGTGCIFYISDTAGNAATHTITINTISGNIDGIGSQTITDNYGALAVVSNGTDYFIF